MKMLRTIGILALVAGLVLGGGGSAFAQDGPPGGGPHSPGKRHGFFGTADSVVGYVLTLTTAEGWTVEVTLTDTAKYMVPRETKGPVGRDEFEAVLGGDITAIEGRRVAVLATNVVGEPPGPFTGDAVRLMLIPSAPLHAHRVGVVGVFTPGSSITIIDKDDVTHTFTLNGTVYRPDDLADEMETVPATAIARITGGCVTVVTKGDPKLPGLVAKAIVLHEPPPEWALP